MIVMLLAVFKIEPAKQPLIDFPSLFFSKKEILELHHDYSLGLIGSAGHHLIKTR